jgi:Fic family protein
VLYLSLFFKKHRMVYYDLLDRVRTHGDWLRWLDFFLEGVLETATGATDKAQRIIALFAEDQAKLAGLGRAKPSAEVVFAYLQRKALCQIPTAAADLGLTQPTVTAALAHLERLGIVAEESGKQRDRVFSYQAYVGLLREE